MKEQLLKVALNLLPFLIGQITPDLKTFLDDQIRSFAVKAQGTDNPIDDVIADLLKALAGVK